ncbi:hypothetical protein ACFYON_04945 [Micromonospora sp. NPDC005686]|uniref:hypothetical protein n=1 Tax=unclassified Micromonospora TaxID=2617518 RepID=UPI0033A81B5D
MGVLLGPIQPDVETRRFRGAIVLSCAAVPTIVLTAVRAALGTLDGGVAAAGLLVPLALAAAGQVAARLSRRYARGRQDGDVTVRRFRIRVPDGGTHWYALEGGVPDEALHAGDIVRARRRRRADVAVVRELDVLATLEGPVIRHVRGRPGSAYLVRAWIDRLCLVVAALAGGGALVLAAGLLA